MKVATFNINNINRRLPNLLRWLRSAKPDAVALQELKSTDATLHPEKPMYTFWHHKRNRWPHGAGLRLDHLLLSPAPVSRLIKAGVDRKLRGEEGASDHAPAWIVLR